MHCVLYLPKASAQLLPPYLTPDMFLHVGKPWWRVASRASMGCQVPPPKVISCFLEPIDYCNHHKPNLVVSWGPHLVPLHGGTLWAVGRWPEMAIRFGQMDIGGPFYNSICRGNLQDTAHNNIDLWALGKVICPGFQCRWHSTWGVEGTGQNLKAAFPKRQGSNGTWSADGS